MWSACSQVTLGDDVTLKMGNAARQLIARPQPSTPQTHGKNGVPWLVPRGPFTQDVAGLVTGIFAKQLHTALGQQGNIF
jgi:hypothetical protein